MRQWNGAALWLVVVALRCGATPFAVDVPPEADALVRSEAPDANYGRGGALAVSGSLATNGSGEQSGTADSFLRFDMASLVGAMDANFGGQPWAIDSVVLRLNEQTRPNNSIYHLGQGDFEVRWIAADGWEEGTGSPKTPPPTASPSRPAASTSTPWPTRAWACSPTTGRRRPTTSTICCATWR